MAVVAEEAGHHPDIDIRLSSPPSRREVLFVLSTHSEGGVTGKDLELAARIDGIARGMSITAS
ncbi:MAG: 4a-hydroxytetrahydrobiopterin dehydratase [Nakamurella multipartita]